MKKILFASIFIILLGTCAYPAKAATVETYNISTFEVATYEAVSVLASKDAALPNLTVIITNFRNNNGIARINLFITDEGFPTEPQKARKALMSGIRNKKVIVVFTCVPSGEYAVSVVHDEEPDSPLITSWLDIPAIGYGSTSKSRNFFERPTFYGAKFLMDDKDQIVNIKIGY